MDPSVSGWPLAALASGLDRRNNAEAIISAKSTRETDRIPNGRLIIMRSLEVKDLPDLHPGCDFLNHQ
jgi:hypothetical protein